MPHLDHKKLAVRPIYAVLFATADDIDAPYSPIISPRHGGEVDATLPHGLDRELAAALPGLWYCLHLPNTLFELIDVNARAIKVGQRLHLDHQILVAPITAFDREHLGEWPSLTTPAFVICPDDLVDQATPKAAALGFPFPPVPYSKLSSESLRIHWRAIHSQFAPDAEYLGREPKLALRLDIQSVDLPRRWLARQFGVDEDAQSTAEGNFQAILEQAVWQQVVLAATARLEDEGTTEQVESRMPQALEEEDSRLRLPVALALPGIPSVYLRRAYDISILARIQPLPSLDERDTWSVTMHERSDALVERSAIEFVTTHRALARGGVGLMLPSLPQEAFTALAALETHFRGAPRGPQVQRLMARLQAAAASTWKEAPVGVIARASTLTVFSNFPIGLLCLPGDTAPLPCRVPIAYRSLLPLTRTIQFELSDRAGVDLTAGFRVLVAECIPETDPVGRASRRGWEVANEIVERSAKSLAASLDYIETPTVEALRATVRERRPDILVLSAHGALDQFGSSAGIVVGDTFCLGPELGQMPPVVILSSCHVAPRGGAAVSITDLLLREGATAVLGTQVPIDVRHNAILMARFFLYITEVLAEREEHSSLLEVWHRVQTSNAINDILNGSRPLRRWGYDRRRNGGNVLSEFMNVRSRSGIRLGHVYKDSERVLLEIAEEDGDGRYIRPLLRSPGYIPESLFYAFIGRPEHVLLRPPIAMPREAWEGMRQWEDGTR